MNLLLEFPSWGEDFKLSDQMLEKLNLTDEEQAALEALYREFHGDAFAQLQKMYGELMGDPDAGMDSTINGLVHNIMNLSPKGACRERVLVLLGLLASGQSLPPLSADSLPCEVAVLYLFEAVDKLEGSATQSLGDRGLKALWSGTSSFTFHYSGNGDAGPE